MIGPAAALDVCRFAHDGSATLLWGVFGYLSVLVPHDLGANVTRRLRDLRVGAVAVAVAATAAALPLEAGYIGGSWHSAVAPGTLRAVLLETTVGRAWQVQGVAALLLLATLAVPGGKKCAATAIASALVLASVALTGHAILPGGWLGVAHRVNDAAHVLAGGAWVGALGALWPIVGELSRPGRRAEAEIAIRRFSSAGQLAVALVILTGIINTLLIVGRWPTNSESLYQMLLLSKIALVVVMIGIATINRHTFLTRASRDPSMTVRALRRGVVAEVILGACVIGLVAVFGMLNPR